MLGREEGKLTSFGCMRISQSRYQAQWRESKCSINDVSGLGNQLRAYKFTPRTTCTTTLEPGETEVPLAGEPMSTLCEKHVVTKAERKAATVNFMVVAIRESLEFVGSESL